MSSTQDPFPEQLGHYRIEALIGRGGMGKVYKAIDTRLDRLVALKVLSRSFFQDDQRLARFDREAKAIASLNHPGIVSIYSIEEDQGVKFLVMELVEGKPLSTEVIPGGAILSRILDLMTPIADALTEAHRTGVTHRDLKPENIMVCSDGRIKVLDFGLAKLAENSSDGHLGETDETISIDANATREGQIIGTPAYMSPEQAEGRDVDGRTDVFSFGVLLYELATGTRPFQGENPMSTLTSILRDDPVPVAELKPSLPRYLGRIISRCLEKAPDRRYQTVVDLRNELEQLHREVSTGELDRPVPIEPPVSRGGSRMAMVVVLLVALLGVGYLLTSMMSESDSNPLVEIQKDAVAVVGFSNLNDPDDEENLGAILSNLITSDLSSAGGITVVSQPRVAHAKKLAGQQQNSAFDSSSAKEIALEAGAAVMIVGTVSRLGEKYIVTAEAIRVEDGTSLISGRADADQADELFAVASTLSGVLRSRLGASSPEDEFDARQRFTGSTAAYRHYVKGTSLLHVRRYKLAIEELDNALEVDPTFARASLDLGIALWWNGNDDRCLATMEKGFAHINRLSREEQHIYRAFYDLLSARGYPNEAIRLLEELEEEGSQNPAVYYLLGECFTHAEVVTDYERAMDLFLHALELDPTYRVVFSHLMESFIRSGRVRDGHLFLDELSKDDPDAPSILSARSTLLLAENRIDEVLALSKKIVASGSANAHTLAFCYAVLGDEEKMAEYEEASLERSEGHAIPVEHLFRKIRRVTLGNFGDAESEWESSWEGHPGDRSNYEVGYPHHVLLGVEYISTLFVRGEYEKGVEIADQLRKRKKFQRVTLYWLARLLIEKGELDGARSILGQFQEEVKGVNSPYVDGQILMLEAMIFHAEGNLPAALEKMKTLSSISLINRDFGVERLFMARLHRESGDLPAALEALQEVRQPVGQFWSPAAMKIDGIYQLAVVEQEIGDAGSARAHLEEFLDHWGEADIPLESVTDAKRRLKFLNSQ